ncbi:hypothetical protein [Bacillus phage vB_BanS-Thrax5]|nr:hypothetical protein [Bacillus phage vB_BanS-Thrax5]
MGCISIYGYAIVAENGKYIHTEQTGDRDIDVYTTDSIDSADIYDTYDIARAEARHMKNNTGKFDYWVSSIPIGVVKIEKTIKIGTVKGLD